MLAARASKAFDDLKDWRGPNTEFKKQRTEIHSEMGSMIPGKNKNVIITGPRTPSGVLYSAQVAGIITWHLDIRPISNQREARGTWVAVQNPDKSWSKQKGRYWLIVAADDKKVTEVAIYTNNNRGLARTPRDQHNKFCSLRPFGDDVEGFVNLIPGNKVLTTEYLQDDDRGAQMMRITMVVKMSELVGRKLHYGGDLRVVGKLDDASRDYAVSMSLGAAGSGR